MTFDRYKFDAGQVIMEDDTGHRVIDTTAPSLNLIPAAKIDKTAGNALNIVFPNFIYAAPQYEYFSGATGGGPPFQERCTTYVMLPGQEWGPDAGGAYALPDVLVGTLPAGTDLIDLFGSLTHTNQPDQIFGQNIIPLQTTVAGEKISFFGGDVMLEFFGIIKRFAVVFQSGQNVYLRRKQSVASGLHRIKTIADKYQGDVFYQTQAPPFPFYDVHYRHHQGGPDACSLAGSIDLSSTWQFDFEVTPINYQDQ